MRKITLLCLDVAFQQSRNVLITPHIGRTLWFDVRCPLYYEYIKNPSFTSQRLRSCVTNLYIKVRVDAVLRETVREKRRFSTRRIAFRVKVAQYRYSFTTPRI